ncbi:hypothetical protein NDU88_000996 [Pleurodeles waltl]|uniref:Uncharacterized protein n=1 Tax=Pleurodeles waltl TaxID=8319 RepID=A0AAV7KRP5_PLEWA|nr:hypothetical protein NDU88_000996 [Pleurodeles waltl]
MHWCSEAQVRGGEHGPGKSGVQHGVGQWAKLMEPQSDRVFPQLKHLRGGVVLGCRNGWWGPTARCRQWRMTVSGQSGCISWVEVAGERLWLPVLAIMSSGPEVREQSGAGICAGPPLSPV